MPFELRRVFERRLPRRQPASAFILLNREIQTYACIGMYIRRIYFYVDSRYRYQGQLFEWNLEKAAVNLAKHGISFETACEVFFDPFICIVDATDQANEARDAAIGLTNDLKVLFVVHLVRGGEELESIRIVS